MCIRDSHRPEGGRVGDVGGRADDEALGGEDRLGLGDRLSDDVGQGEPAGKRVDEQIRDDGQGGQQNDQQRHPAPGSAALGARLLFAPGGPGHRQGPGRHADRLGLSLIHI